MHYVPESEVIRNDGFKCCYVAYNADSAYRMLWFVGKRALELREAL